MCEQIVKAGRLFASQRYPRPHPTALRALCALAVCGVCAIAMVFWGAHWSGSHPSTCGQNATCDASRHRADAAWAQIFPWFQAAAASSSCHVAARRKPGNSAHDVPCQTPAPRGRRNSCKLRFSSGASPVPRDDLIGSPDIGILPRHFKRKRQRRKHNGNML